MARESRAERVLGLGRFTEDHLYENLRYLSEHQAEIEDRLFGRRYGRGRRSPGLFLYDVTSSYLEGTENALLLCDAGGWLLSIEAFAGNAQDPATVSNQIRKVAVRFGGGEVTSVGDRGMLESRPAYTTIALPNEENGALLAAAGVTLPRSLPASSQTGADTKRKLRTRRERR